MTKINLLLGSISIIVVLGVLKLFEVHVPSPVGTAVIAEKQGGENGQIAVKLPESMTAKQHRLLNMAYETAKKNGFLNPEVLQAVVLQETMAGGMDSYRVANPGKEAYFGPAQIKLAAAGADIIAVDLCEQIASVPYPLATPDDLAATVALVEATGARIVARQADVRDRAGLKSALREGIAELGRLDIVIVNAGTYAEAAVEELGGEVEWE